MWEIAKIIAGFLLFILMMLILGLGGCTSKQIEYVKVNDTKIQLYAGEIQQPNVQKYNTELYEIGSTEYSCVKLKDYTIVVKNYQELKAYIRQQKDIIEFYEKQIERIESTQ